MKIELTKCNFMDCFRNLGRYDQFGYEALSALYDYLEDIDPDYSLDVIAICCDWAVYDSIAEAAIASGYDASRDRIEKYAESWLSRRTTIIPFDGGVLVQAF